jgi:hypothetical protein
MQSGDVVYVDVGDKRSKLVFLKYGGGPPVNDMPQSTSETK